MHCCFICYTFSLVCRFSCQTSVQVVNCYLNYAHWAIGLVCFAIITTFTSYLFIDWTVKHNIQWLNTSNLSLSLTYRLPMVLILCHTNRFVKFFFTVHFLFYQSTKWKNVPLVSNIDTRLLPHSVTYTRPLTVKSCNR